MELESINIKFTANSMRNNVMFNVKHTSKTILFLSQPSSGGQTHSKIHTMQENGLSKLGL